VELIEMWLQIVPAQMVFMTMEFLKLVRLVIILVLHVLILLRVQAVMPVLLLGN
jgi:hypothetical protein